MLINYWLCGNEANSSKMRMNYWRKCMKYLFSIYPASFTANSLPFYSFCIYFLNLRIVHIRFYLIYTQPKHSGCSRSVVCTCANRPFHCVCYDLLECNLSDNNRMLSKISSLLLNRIFISHNLSSVRETQERKRRRLFHLRTSVEWRCDYSHCDRLFSLSTPSEATILA